MYSLDVVKAKSHRIVHMVDGLERRDSKIGS